MPSSVDSDNQSTIDSAASTRAPSYVSTSSSSTVGEPSPRSSNGLQEYVYDLTNSGKPYLSVTFWANPNLARHQPTIVQGMTLRGNVNYSAGKGEDILSITGTVLGKLIYGSHDGGGKTLVFLNLQRQFLSRKPGSQKPSGDFSWTFDIELPKTVTIRISETSEETRTFVLPQTTQERASRASTVYEMSFQITRGKFKSNKELTFPFNYIPVTPPPALPKAFGTAYQEGTSLPSPSVAPSEWCALEQVRIKGKLFGERPVDVGCTLSLANPLEYTRGSVIPLCIEFEGTDQEALQLLGSPTSILVCMKRAVNTHPIPTKKVSDIHIWKPISSYSRPAVWEPISSDDSSIQKTGPMHRLTLRGEIHLQLDLKPSTLIGHFTIDYSVIMVTPAVPGFVSSDDNPSQVLVTKDIQIVTAYASGPRPKKMLPISREPLDEIFKHRPKDFNLKHKVCM